MLFPELRRLHGGGLPDIELEGGACVGRVVPGADVNPFTASIDLNCLTCLLGAVDFFFFSKG